VGVGLMSAAAVLLPPGTFGGGDAAAAAAAAPHPAADPLRAGPGEVGIRERSKGHGETLELVYRKSLSQHTVSDTNS
jgi:hypothetical protein